MVSKRCGAVVLALAAAGAATGSIRAQQAPAEPVALTYKFSPGQKHQYRLQLRGEMIVETQGGAAEEAGRMPVKLDGHIDLVQKVAGVADDGTGSLALWVKSVALTSRFQRSRLDLRFDGAKFTALVDGKPVKGKSFDVAAKTLRKPVTYKMRPNGAVVEMRGSLAALYQALPGGMAGEVSDKGSVPGIGLAALPIGEMVVNKVWRTEGMVALPIRSDGAQAGEPAALHVRTLSSLDGVKSLANGRVAVIRVTGDARNVSGDGAQAVPPAIGSALGSGIALDPFVSRFNGRILFDPDAGVLRQARATTYINLGLVVPGASAGAQAGAAPKKVAITGNMRVQLTQFGFSEKAPAHASNVAAAK